MKKTFYRVSNVDTEQGLWYDFKGNFTGLIHSEFDFCQNSTLKMPFDEELVGYLSAVEDLEDLWQWFSKEDIKKLQENGFFIHEYEATEYKFYVDFKHTVIKQETSILTKRIILL